MADRLAGDGRDTGTVAADGHQRTVEVVTARAVARGIKVEVADGMTATVDATTCALLLSYPTTDGAVRDYRAVTDRAHKAGALVIVATDLLALTLLTPPGEWGADIAVGNSQRFGVPFG